GSCLSHASGHRRVPPALPTRRSSDLFRLNSSQLPSAKWLSLSQSTLVRPLSRLPRTPTATAGLLLSRRRNTASWTTSSILLPDRSEEHTSELQSRFDLVCRLLLAKQK